MGVLIYNKLNKDIKKKCTEAKENWLSNKWLEIENSNKRNDNQLYKDIKEMTNSKSSTNGNDKKP